MERPRTFGPGPLGLGDCEGGWNQRGIDYYTRRAKGGTGLIITGVTFSDIEVEKPSFPNTPNSTYNPVQFVRAIPCPDAGTWDIYDIYRKDSPERKLLEQADAYFAACTICPCTAWVASAQ